MKLIKLKKAFEYRSILCDLDYKAKVNHYIVELDDKEYKRLLELTKGQVR